MFILSYITAALLILASLLPAYLFLEVLLFLFIHKASNSYWETCTPISDKVDNDDLLFIIIVVGGGLALGAWLGIYNNLESKTLENLWLGWYHIGDFLSPLVLAILVIGVVYVGINKAARVCEKLDSITGGKR